MPVHSLAQHAPESLIRFDFTDEIQSPAGTKRAVVFESSCGATTGFVTHVSVLDLKEALTRSAGNVFIGDADRGVVQYMRVRVDWTSSDSLVVSYPARARVFRQEARVGGVGISYKKMP